MCRNPPNVIKNIFLVWVNDENLSPEIYMYTRTIYNNEIFSNKEGTKIFQKGKYPSKILPTEVLRTTVYIVWLYIASSVRRLVLWVVLPYHVCLLYWSRNCNIQKVIVFWVLITINDNLSDPNQGSPQKKTWRAGGEPKNTPNFQIENMQLTRPAPIVSE